jgi:hypothetical protein
MQERLLDDARQPVRLSQSPRVALFAVLAIALVLFRAFAPTWYEGYHFDSDQAVVGLMAKHISELRAFPLFVYGQDYILAVQAWLAAPFFLIGGPTVAMLRVPLVLINGAVAVLLIVLLVRDVRLRPALAFIASLPFLMPTPMTASHLVEALGYSVEPLLYILLLWMLRRRGLLFGLVLIVGFLHREFTAYALPALAIVMAIEGSLFTRETLERAAGAAIVCVVVWVIVEILKRHADALGPSSGPVGRAPLSIQWNVLTGHVCSQPQAVMARVRSFWTDCLSGLFGARRFFLWEYQVGVNTRTGSTAVGWVLGAAAALIVVRTPALVRRHTSGSVLFCGYLAIVGLESALAYPLSCDVMPGFPGVIRYVLLVLLVPAALGALYLARETVPALKALVVAVLIGWAAYNFTDTVRAIRSYATNPPPNHRRLLANYLTAAGIQYSRADYWDAYITDFYARERVVVATTRKVRVRAYEQAVDAHAGEAATIVRGTCRGAGTVMDAWCIRQP